MHAALASLVVVLAAAAAATEAPLTGPDQGLNVAAVIAATRARAARACAASWPSLEAHRATTAPARQLVYRVPPATTSGISDHLTGLVSAYALALATARHFVVDWPALRDSCAASHTFLDDAARARLAERLDDFEDVDVELYNWLPRSAASAEDNMVVANPRLNATFAAPTVVVQWRRGVLYQALSSAARAHPFGARLAALGLDPERAFGCLHRFLIEPHPDIFARHLDAVDQLRGAASILGLHVRTGDNAVATLGADGVPVAQESGPPGGGLDAPMYDGYTGTVSKGTNRAMGACAVQAEHGHTWFVASDSAVLGASIVDEYNGQGGRVALRASSLVPRHSAPWMHVKNIRGFPLGSNEDASWTDSVTEYENDPVVKGALLAAAQDALAEQWLLAEASVFVLGPYSGFPRVSYALALALHAEEDGDAAKPQGWLVAPRGDCFAPDAQRTGFMFGLGAKI